MSMSISTFASNDRNNCNGNGVSGITLWSATGFSACGSSSGFGKYSDISNNVDCTSNGSSVYIAYDRKYGHAQWARMNGTTRSGPYAVVAEPCANQVCAAGSCWR